MARYAYAGNEFSGERAIVAGELYRKNGDWKFSAVGRGFNGGLRALVESFGGVVSDPVPPPPPPVRTAVSARTTRQPAAPAGGPPPSVGDILRSLPPHVCTRMEGLARRCQGDLDFLAPLYKASFAALAQVPRAAERDLQTVLCADASGSMFDLYRGGRVQQMFDKFFALSSTLSDSGALDCWAFAAKSRQLEPVTLDNIRDYTFSQAGGYERWMSMLNYQYNNEPEAMRDIMPSPTFKEELDDLLRNFAGRETPLTYCPTLSKRLGFSLWLKREDLLHTGAHKVNNTLGQALLAKHMGKTALVAETGAGQHGVATAAAAARLGLECIVFMGAEDVERQSSNVRRMKLLGAEVRPVQSGTRTLKDAINEALRYWIAAQETTHYCFGTAAGPHPFPTLVRNLQSVIGRETRAQMLEKTGRLPDVVVAAVGGGSNAIGMFHPFVDDASVRIIGVEAAGTGEPGCYNSAPINLGTPGVLHGQMTMLLQTKDGQIEPSHSVSAGLDYPGVGPEHAYLSAIGRVHYGLANDAEALDAFQTLCRTEGILPALESSHALAWVLRHHGELPAGGHVVVNLSGRGDKDMDIVEQHLHIS